jgi:poly(3-hydroxybutyrate) depolymerase
MGTHRPGPGLAMASLSRRVLLTSGAACLVAGKATAQAEPDLQALATRWSFTDWAGPAVGMWTYTPDGVARSAPVIMVLHGVNRDADRYFAEWADLARTRGFSLIVPEFDRTGFPGAVNYNQGRVFADETGRVVRPRGEWSFSVLDRLFAAWRRRQGASTQRFHLYGHSAGSQFVHRAMLASPPRRVARIVAANAGFYTFPATDRAWPFGVKDTPFGERDLRRWLMQPMQVLLGTADNDPAHRSLNRDPGAMEQGAHRLARGEAFFAAASALAARRAWRFGWSKSYAPGIDHNNGLMAPFAADLLLGKPGLPGTPG